MRSFYLRHRHCSYRILNHCVGIEICSITLIETAMYLPHKSYFLLWRELRSDAGGANAPVHFLLNLSNHHVYATRSRSEIRRELLMRENCTNRRENLLRVRGVREGGTRSNIARSVLSLIFTFPLIFTWTRGQTRYHDTSRTLFVKTTLKSNKQNSLRYVSMTHASLRGHGTFFFRQNGYRRLIYRL